jgi:RNA polymerase sigma-70 factor (ECF subfamily)
LNRHLKTGAMKQDKFGKNINSIIDKLFRLALSITGNKQDAEDVVQDTMFHVWRKKDEWDAIHNLDAYCFRSARNLALDKIALKENQQESIPDNFDVPERGKSIHERMEEEEQLRMLEEQLQLLPEKQRTIFQLREVEEFTYKQISEILNISEEQVKVNLLRTRQNLKDYFDKNKGNERR